MHRPPDPALWTGREDAGEGPRALRWHQRVEPWRPGAAPGVALAGFACDAGVARNGGRTGAAEGPAALRRGLGNLAWHRRGPAWDAGDVVCEEDGLEAAQAELSALVARLLGEGQLPVALGGGHEVALGTFLGLAEHAARSPAAPRLAVLNVDAHLDLREAPRPTSGTPFRDVARECQRRGWTFRYLCLGVDEDANTGALLDGAGRLGAAWLTDRTLLERGAGWARDAVAAFLEGADAVHLSLDLDALQAGVAPGVSAPAARGLPLHLVEAVVDAVVESGRLAAADVAELCPRLDPDGRTARAAARLVARLAGRG
jgi:formiminoglutamase